MELKVLKEKLSVCRLASMDALPGDATPLFLGRTAEELSLVCPTEAVPAETLAREDGWRGFFIAGVLDFSLIGILARIAAVLAEEKIGIFVVSTYNTDYVLTKEAHFDRALAALAKAGYSIVGISLQKKAK